MTATILEPLFASPLAHIALAVFCLVAVALSYRAQQGAPRARLGLACLRGLAALMIVALLADPHELTQEVTERAPSLAVLVDRSASVEGRAQVELDELLAELVQSFDLELFAFGGDTVGLGRVERGEAFSWPTARPVDATCSALGDALEHVQRAVEGTGTRGLLLVSDGRETAGGHPLDAARRAALPVYTLAAAGETATELRIVGVDGPAAVFLDDRLSLYTVIEQQGLEGEHATLSLLRDGELLETRELLLSASSQIVNFEHDAQSAGLFTYEVRVAVSAAGELEDFRSHIVRVIDDALRVLYVQELPSWEWRFLREALVRDPLVRDGFDTHLLSAAPQVAIADNEFLRDLPEGIEGLREYDVVLLGDAPMDALPTRFQRALSEFVSEHGGGLLFIAGRTHAPQRFRGTVLEEMLPVRLGELDAGYVDEEFQVVPSMQGEEHQALRLHALKARNADVWRELPTLRSYFPVSSARQLSTVLLQGANAEAAPLFASRRFGAGQVAFSGTDSTWRWRSLENGLYYDRFWGQLVRWLGMPRRLARAHSSRLEPQAGEIELGAAVHLGARLAPEDQARLIEAGGELRCFVKRGAEAPEPIALRARIDAPHELDGRFLPRRAGVYTVWLEIGESTPAWTRFDVHPAPVEESAAGADAECLAAIARESGGRAFAQGEFGALAELVAADEVQGERSVRTQLLRRHAWLVLLALTLLLAGEWAGRKLAGLK